MAGKLINHGVGNPAFNIYIYIYIYFFNYVYGWEADRSQAGKPNIKYT